MTQSFSLLSRTTRTAGLALVLSFCAQIGSSHADVTYDFAFTNLHLQFGNQGPLPSFNVLITEPAIHYNGGPDAAEQSGFDTLLCCK